MLIKFHSTEEFFAELKHMPLPDPIIRKTWMHRRYSVGKDRTAPCRDLILKISAVRGMTAVHEEEILKLEERVKTVYDWVPKESLEQLRDFQQKFEDEHLTKLIADFKKWVTRKRSPQYIDWKLEIRGGEYMAEGE